MTKKKTTHKSKIVAVILAFLVGMFGAHNFYLGYYPKGIVQLLFTLLSCFLLSGIVALWAFIEAILILTGKIVKDATGALLVD